MKTILTIISAAALLMSCSSTKITSSWKAENTAPRVYKNVMVWGILTEKDSTLRREMETHLVNDLVTKGYHAISSLDVYGRKAYQKLTEKEIVDEFRNSAVDAVITIVLLDKAKEEVFVAPAVMNTSPNALDHVDKYYSAIYDKVFNPGYYVTTTNYFLEGNLFEVQVDKRVYTARTRSFDPASSDQLAHEYGLSILKNMLKKKLIFDQVKKED